jgi:hypothetical protein
MKHNWFLAYVWWLLWGFGRWLWHAEGREHPIDYWRTGRGESWYPLRCAACGWRGPERWAKHDYEVALGEVAPITRCPGCREEFK